MSAIGRRVRAERDVWKAVWQQMETYLDRVDGCADQDEAYASSLCAILTVLQVVERARKRALGYGLEPALPAVPGGKGLTVAVEDLLATTAGDPAQKQLRLPGLEVCELACAPVSMPDGDSTHNLVLTQTVTLATFRDARRHLEGARPVPAYDNGALSVPPDGDGKPVNAFELDLDELGDDEDYLILFSMDAREAAQNGDEFELVKWSALRDNRLGKVEASLDPQHDIPLGARFDQAGSRAALEDVGARAQQASSDCDADRAVFTGAREDLEAAGAPGELLGAVSAVEAQLATQAADYAWCSQQLRPPAIDQLDQAHLGAIRYRLYRADGPGGPGLSPELVELEAQASAAFDHVCEGRIAYPDGPLRMLRLLEQGLRYFWKLRSRWMNERYKLLTRQLAHAFWAPFLDSLTRAIAGQPSGLILPGGTRTTEPTNARATRIRLTGIPLPATFWPGQLARIAGDRPAAAVVTDLGVDKDGLFLTTTPIELSFAVDPDLPGVPGLVPPGAPVTADFPHVTEAEWRRGKSARGAAHDALITGLVAHASRLALMLGKGHGDDRPAPPSLPAPYPGIDVFELDGPVVPEAARLFLHAVPAAAASGTGEALGVARPGELMLVRGRDEDGFVWQGVVEVDHCEIVTGADARKDDAISATPTPPCCADDAEVMVVYLRSMQMPSTLVSHVTLRRDFLGFGLRSLLSGAILPSSLDVATAVPSVTIDGASKLVLRDHELKTASRVFEDWLGRDTGAKP